MLTRAPQVIVTRADLPAATLAELVAYAKSHPGKLNYASSGNGSIQHIAGELFKQLTGTFITHIPYRGAGPAGAGPDGRPGRPVHHHAGRGGAAGEGRPAEGAGGDQRHATEPRCRRCPPPWKRGSRASRSIPGSRSTAPPACPTEVVQMLSTEVGKILSLPDTRRKAEESGTSVEQMSPVHNWPSSPARNWTTGAR